MEVHRYAGHVEPNPEHEQSHREQPAEDYKEYGVPEKDLRVAEKWERAIPEMGYVGIPDHGSAVECVGEYTRQYCAIHQHGKSKVLHTFRGMRKNNKI